MSAIITSISAAAYTGQQIATQYAAQLINAINTAEGYTSGGNVPYAGLQGSVNGLAPGYVAASALVQQIYQQWLAAGEPGDFLPYLASIWAPVGAANDPQNLNANWLGNVETALAAQGLPVIPASAYSATGTSISAAPTSPASVPASPASSAAAVSGSPDSFPKIPISAGTIQTFGILAAAALLVVAIAGWSGNVKRVQVSA